MRYPARRHGIRLQALLLALFMLAVIATAGLYCAANLHHQCVGEHCPICANMHMLLSLAAGFSQTVFFLWFFTAIFSFSQSEPLCRRISSLLRTPVQLYDRMND